MPALMAQAAIDVTATAKQVRDVLADFYTWPAWSPWLYLEPQASLSYEGQAGLLGHGYDWSGSKIGAGGMSLVAVTDERIDCFLQFRKPFKSTAKVYFTLQESTSGSTKVTWYMDSQLPFFMFFMKGTMNGMIRSDYRRGLELLKDYIEQGQVLSHSEYIGMVDVDGCDYVGYRSNTAMTEISKSTNAAFEQLNQAEQGGKFEREGNAFRFSERMNYKHDTCQFAVALPTKSLVQVDKPLFAAHRPACRALKVVHTGPYHHLGNAWSMLITASRQQPIKPSKSIMPFTCYLADASITPAKELVAELFLPLRE